MNLKKGQEFECVIDKLGFGGVGVSRIDDFVIFFKGGLPGQTVKAVLTKLKKSYGEANIVEILKTSSDEIAPKCAHFGICGGCKWQTLTYEKQLEYKAQQVKECLEKIGEIDCSKVNIEPVQASPNTFAYRNKVEFSFGYTNMWIDKTDEENWVYHDEDPSLGFHSPGKWEKIVNIDHCDLVTENVNNVFAIIKKWTFEQSKSVHNPKTHQGLWRHILVRENLKGELLLNLIYAEELEKDTYFADLLPLLQKANVKSFFTTLHTGLNDDWTKGQITKQFGEDVIYEKLFDLQFAVSPQSFFQTNSCGAEVLYSKVKEYALGNDTNVDLSILDLYCGTGTIGQILAGENKDAKIIGLELLESAVADAYINAELNGLENVEFIAGPAERTLSKVLEQYKDFDIVVIDPPRNGMHPKALETVLELMPREIVYVSCNPSTLARDIKELCKAGYVLEKVCPVDMFPHTSHIEVVTKLIKK